MAEAPKTLIWDIDGVLIWHHPTDPTRDWRNTLIRENLLETWEWFQRSEDYRACLRDERLDVRQALERFLGRNSTSAERMTDVWLSGNIVPSLPGISRLKALRDKGYECAIASNQDGLRAKLIDQWLEEYGLGDVPAFISCRIGIAKPEIRFFEFVQSALLSRPADLFLFDDASVNIDTVEKLGWKGLLISLPSADHWPETPDL